MNVPQIVMNSVVTGSIYVLIAVGLTLVLRILKLVNFAHAEFVTFGAYIAYAINVTLGKSLVWGAVAAFLTTGLLAVASDFLFFKPLRRRGSTVISSMIVSIGLGLVIRHIIQEVWGAPMLWYNLGRVRSYQLLTASLTDIDAQIIVTSLALIFSLHILLTRTKLGKAMRATSDNLALAMSSGINTERIIVWVWFIGAGIAGVGGVLRGADTRLVPLMGWELLLPAFAVVVLGGIGSFYGAILAAYILGFAENLGVVLLIELSLSTTYRLAIAFIILITVLLVKPTGIMGLKEPGRK
ncbi:MAG: branched-chain amino acid ABC transporter permease [Candidatus Bathyarchaeia archaeon]